MRGVHYPRTFSTDLINCTCKISGQETLVVNGGEIRPRRCSGPWPIPTVSVGVTYAVVDTYGCDDGRTAPTRCAIIAAGLDGR
jgi:hypothetical protein